MAEKLPFTQIWKERIGYDLDLPEIDLFRPVTPENIYYLANQYPFLQMIDTMAMFLEEVVPEFITSKSGWLIHDFSDAITSSPGEHLYGGADSDTFTKNALRRLRGEEEGEGEDTGEEVFVQNPGKGTIVKQAYDTSYDMVTLAQKHKWAGIRIVDGTRLMKWAVWSIGKDHELEIEGFEPTEKDHERRERVARAITISREKALELEF